MKTKICKECGYIGKPIADEYSSFSVDLFIYILYLRSVEAKFSIN